MDQSRADQPAVVLPDRNHIVRDLSLLAGDRYIIAEVIVQPEDVLFRGAPASITISGRVAGEEREATIPDVHEHLCPDEKNFAFRVFFS